MGCEVPAQSKNKYAGIQDQGFYSEGLRHLILHWADVNDVRNFSNDPSALLNILYILKSICATGNFGPHLCGLAQAEQKSAAHLQSSALTAHLWCGTDYPINCAIVKLLDNCYFFKFSTKYPQLFVCHIPSCVCPNCILENLSSTHQHPLLLLESYPLICLERYNAEKVSH